MCPIMIAALATGIVLGLSAGLSPGPFFALVISQSLQHGAREGMKTAVAPLITDAPIILVSALVLTRLSNFQVVLGVITLAGAGFVSYLAYESLRTAGFDLTVEAAQPKSLRTGVLVNFLNPHPYLFWLTVGAPIVLKAWAENPLAGVFFLASFYCCLIGSKIVVAAATARSRRFFAGSAYVCIMRLLGALLFLFAMMLFWNALGFLGVVGSDV